jgi:hypothetical protein
MVLDNHKTLLENRKIEKNKIPKESPPRQNCKMLQARFD